MRKDWACRQQSGTNNRKHCPLIWWCCSILDFAGENRSTARTNGEPLTAVSDFFQIAISTQLHITVVAISPSTAALNIRICGIAIGGQDRHGQRERTSKMGQWSEIANLDKLLMISEGGGRWKTDPWGSHFSWNTYNNKKSGFCGVTDESGLWKGLALSPSSFWERYYAGYCIYTYLSLVFGRNS